MKGHPKYNLGDKVIISLTMPNEEPKEHVGEVYIIDKYGTWDDPTDVSYDVMIHDYRHPSHPEVETDCLVKHCTERTVQPYIEEDTSYAKNKQEV